jgi:hypothetical protein
MEREGVGDGVPDVHARVDQQSDALVYVGTLPDADEGQELGVIGVRLPERAVVHVGVGGPSLPLLQLEAHHHAVVHGLHLGLLDDLEVDVAAGEPHHAHPLAAGRPQHRMDELEDGDLVLLRRHPRHAAPGGARDPVAAERAMHVDDLQGGRSDVDPVTHRILRAVKVPTAS